MINVIDNNKVIGKKYLSKDNGFLPKLDITNSSYSPDNLDNVITNPIKNDIGNVKNKIFGIVYEYNITSSSRFNCIIDVNDAICTKKIIDVILNKVKKIGKKLAERFLYKYFFNIKKLPL
jgi:hypothetical protein